MGNTSFIWDIDQMKPLSATVVLFFIHSELSPFYAAADAVERRKLGVNKKEPQ